MPDESAPPRQVTIRPAGWVVIVLAIVGIGWLGWHFGAPLVKPLLERTNDEATAPPVAVVRTVEGDAGEERAGEERAGEERAGEERAGEERAGEEAPAPSTILSRQLFPSSAPGLPAPSPAFPKLAWPPLAGLTTPEMNVYPAPSEREALRMLARGEAEYAVASIAALASVPEVTLAGARVVWSLGLNADAARLFPSCAPNVLRQATLGAEAGSAGHLELLGAFVGSEAPPLTTFDRYADLEAAISEGAITGGAWRDEGERCDTLPVAVTTLLVVRGPKVNVDAAQVAAIAALAPNASPAEDVAAFFDETRATAGGFFEVYEKTQQVWKRVQLVQTTVRGSEAIDRSLLGTHSKPVVQEEKEEAEQETAQAPRVSFGRPSWPDIH